MQCNERKEVKCVNKNRLEWETWKVIYPENVDNLKIEKVLKIRKNSQINVLSTHLVDACVEPPVADLSAIGVNGIRYAFCEFY